MSYAINHLTAVAGVTFAVYFLWSMVLDPASGPLPGTLLPLVVGVAGLGLSLLVAARGVRRIYF